MWKQSVEWILFSFFQLPDTTLAGALNFFIYDTGKIFALLFVIIFAISLIRSFFPIEKSRTMIAKLPPVLGNILASFLGILTPFCSCSAVPLFIGFVNGGIPLGVTFSFLVASPMINEVALVMLAGLFGWKISLIYISSGLIIAITSGVIIGLMKIDSQVEPFVYNTKMGNLAVEHPGMKDRIKFARESVLEIVGKVWPYVLIAIAVGAFIHGYVPEKFFVRYLGAGTWYSVPLATLLGVPLYSNAAGMIPVISALFEKGVPLGTALAFMMAVTALSLPEFIILRKVLKPRLLVIFFGIVTIGIMITGFIFNAIRI